MKHPPFIGSPLFAVIVLAVICAVFAVCTMAVNFICGLLSSAPIDPSTAIFTSAALLMWACYKFAQKYAPHEARGITIVVTALKRWINATTYFASGFPGMTPGWRTTWWKRLLDLPANGVWFLALGFAVLLWFASPAYSSPAWWQVWLIFAVPGFAVQVIRWVIIFIVQGPAPKEQDAATPLTSAPILKLPPASSLPRAEAQPGTTQKRPAQFLPAMSKQPTT